MSKFVIKATHNNILTLQSDIAHYQLIAHDRLEQFSGQIGSDVSQCVPDICQSDPSGGRFIRIFCRKVLQWLVHSTVV